MYPSDYGYSVNSTYRTQSINSNNGYYAINSWLKKEKTHRFVSPDAYYNFQGMIAAWLLKSNGRVHHGAQFYSDNKYYIYPTFYLNPNVQYKSGEGTKVNPYRISINE